MNTLGSLLERLARVAAGRIAILAGSVPPGVSHLVHRESVVRLMSRGVRALVDASGAALASALDASPELIKPNVEEAGEILGRALRGDSEVLRAAEELRARGPRCVVISQGADGAIGVDESGAWEVVPPAVEVLSTVGSGDSMMAGLAIAMNEGRGLAEGLRLGTAAGAATAAVPGTRLGAAEHVLRVLPRSSSVNLRTRDVRPQNVIPFGSDITRAADLACGYEGCMGAPRSARTRVDLRVRRGGLSR